MMALPFKVTNNTNNDTTTIEKTEPYNPLPLTPSGLHSFISDLIIGKYIEFIKPIIKKYVEIKNIFQTK